MSYRIKTVSEITGIPKNTLIAWERRYDFPSPDRQPNGYRVYSERDLAELRRVKELLDDGYKISEALLLARRKEGAADARDARPAGATSGRWDDLATVRGELVAAFRDFDPQRADRALDTLVGSTYAILLHDVFFPVLREIGDGWASGEVSIAQEHFAAGYLRERMMRMLLSIGSGPSNGPLVGCVTFPGEQHELGLLGLAIHLALAGWRVAWLGNNLPADEVAAFAQQTRPVMLCVSLVHDVDAAEIEAYARQVRAAIGAETAIVIGGPGTRNLALEIPGVRFTSDTAALLAS